MSRTYDIHRWDGIILPSMNAPQPGVYIRPDEELFALLSQKNVLSVRFKNTNSIYENKIAYAEIRPSAVTGGFRPNFQEQTGLVVLLPDLTWEGYPDTLGQVEILGFGETPELDEDDDETPGDKYPNRITNVLLTVIACALLFVLLYLISKLV